MPSQEPTFWPLNGQVDPQKGGRAGWRVAREENVAVSPSDIRLAVDPQGPLSFGWIDDSLGGLVLPRGMALDREGRLYLLSRRTATIRRFNPLARGFEDLPALGGEGTDARQFRQPQNIAVHDRALYVADTGNRRVQVFAIDSLMLRYIWTRADWEPIDVAAGAAGVVILDRRGCLFLHAPGRDRLALLKRLPSDQGAVLRVAADRTGAIYVLRRQGSRHLLDVYGPDGSFLETNDDPGDVRDRFDPPAIRLFYPSASAPREQGRFCLPDGLRRVCERRTEPVSLERPLAACLPAPLPISAEAYAWRAKDLKDAHGLALCWREGCDRVSRYLRSLLSEETGARLDAWIDGPLPDDLRHRLVWELNQLQKRPLLYSHSAFALVELRAEARALLSRTLGEVERARLHRMLLEDAYPGELAASPFTAPAPLVFNREGEPAAFDPAEAAGPALYRRQGAWVTEALDSRRYRCQWHRVELDLSNLPPGSQITVSTYASDQNAGPPALEETVWQFGATFTGEMQPHGQDGSRRGQPYEFLVQSREGQYLWLKVELQGDGYSSPAVVGLRVHFPRESYLRYLPAIFSAEEQSRVFLERFLSIFQTEWDDLEQRIDDISGLFDPAAVPAKGGFLEELARWLALPLEGSWKLEQKRVLLKAMPHIMFQMMRHEGPRGACWSGMQRRGTAGGLRDYLRAYLQNIAGLTDKAMAAYPAYPRLVEGFQARRRLVLAQAGGAELSLGGPLWSPSEIGRLQVGIFSELGEVRLVSPGEPDRDLFNAYAHRFQVFVPAAWVQTVEAERMLRRAVEAEKPAHAAYELRLIEPRLRVGVQSTIGLDTIVGGYPAARLACRDDDRAPSLPPRSRLGYDMILGGSMPEPLRLSDAARIGLSSTLR